MTATAVIRRPDAWGSNHHARHGVLKILRGAAWKAGWVIVKHEDRLMPYPTSGYNSVTTSANGGPLQVAGADADGGLRLIAKRPNVTYAQVDGGAAISIAVSLTLPEIVVTAPAATTSAAAVRTALLADARTAALVDVAYTGTGAGDIAAFAAAAVPHVAVYGISKTERSNADDATNDNALILGDPEEMFEFGYFAMVMAATPAVPSNVFLIDNQTVQQNHAPLLLPLECVSHESGRAICRIA